MDEEERYQKYVGKKWFQGKQARSRENWRTESKRRGGAREFGNIFRDGMSQLLGRTPEAGWGTEVYRQTDKRARFDDVANRQIGHAMEFKAGNVKREALKQLEKDEYGIRRGLIVEWYLAPGAKIDKAVEAKMVELAARFPEQFRVITVTREQFAKAIELGKEIAKQREAQQKAAELHKSLDKGQAVARQTVSLIKAAPDKARQVEQADKAREITARELAEKKGALAKALEDQARQINETFDKGQAVDLAQTREAHTNLSKSLAEIRETELAQARDALITAGHTPQQAHELARLLTQAQEVERHEVVLGIDTIGAIVERENKAREAADKAREALAPVPETAKARGSETDRERRLREAREALAQQVETRRAELTKLGVPQEVQKLMSLGQIPMTAEETERRRQLEHPDIVGRSRDLSQGRDRGRERG